MNVEFKNQTIAQAVETFGSDHQLDLAIEEMSELTKALLKHRRAMKQPEAWDHERTKSNIVEEIADVEIMIEQLKLIFNCFSSVNKQKEFKLNRLAERIEQIKEINNIYKHTVDDLDVDCQSKTEN